MTNLSYVTYTGLDFELVRRSKAIELVLKARYYIIYPWKILVLNGVLISCKMSVFNVNLEQA